MRGLRSKRLSCVTRGVCFRFRFDGCFVWGEDRVGGQKHRDSKGLECWVSDAHFASIWVCPARSFRATTFPFRSGRSAISDFAFLPLSSRFSPAPSLALHSKMTAIPTPVSASGAGSGTPGRSDNRRGAQIDIGYEAGVAVRQVEREHLGIRRARNRRRTHTGCVHPPLPK